MQKNELYIDIACYNLLINAACKDGKLEIAKELLNEVFSNGLQPIARTYSAIINGLCQEGSLDEAKELLTRMEDNGCFPTEFTYNVIVRGFLKKNHTYEAMALLEKTRESGFSVDNSTIETLVEVLQMREQDPTLLNMIQKLAPKDINFWECVDYFDLCKVLKTVHVHASLRRTGDVVTMQRVVMFSSRRYATPLDV
ncbi:hypothetical protein LguiB_013980 [Lonicera macranthoides]